MPEIVKSKNLPETPTEEMWGGLAKKIILFMDTCNSDTLPTAGNLLKFLSHLGLTEDKLPQWLKDEPEMKNLTSVISKGTRATLIYKAMWHAYKEGH